MAKAGHMKQSSVSVCGAVLVFDGFLHPTTAATVDTSFSSYFEAAAEAAIGWRKQLAVKRTDESVALSGLTLMTEDVTWQSSLGASIPPTHTSGAGILDAKPCTDCAAQASTSLNDHLFAHLPDSAAVSRLAQSERALQMVLVDADSSMRIFFRLTFATCMSLLPGSDSFIRARTKRPCPSGTSCKAWQGACSDALPHPQISRSFWNTAA
jgi:hypothetical protein